MAKKDALKSELTALVAALGDHYGQESGDHGTVQETDAGTIAEAVPGCLGAEYTIVSNKLLDLFKSVGGKNRNHKKFIKLVEDHGLEFGTVEYASVGEPDLFDPDANDPGGLYFCFLFIRLNASDKNLFVSFRSAMT